MSLFMIYIAAVTLNPVLELRLVVAAGYDGLIQIVRDDSLPSKIGATEIRQRGTSVSVPVKFFDPEGLWHVTEVFDSTGKRIPIGKNLPEGTLAFRGKIYIDGRNYFILSKSSNAHRRDRP